MEKSMKRAEKLVHATNSALAQMKFSLMFDEGLMGGDRSFRRTEAAGPRFCLEGDELKQCQDEFRAEANEMLMKMENMFGSTDPNRKKWKPLDRIKEINRKMNALRQDRSKPGGTEQSSEKLVSLLAEEKLSPQKTSSKGSLRPRQPEPPMNQHHNTPKNPPSAQSPAKSKEDLKTNILETHEVVDRGFHTARHLAQKVDSIVRSDCKRTPSEVNPRSLDGRSESNESGKEGKDGGGVGEGLRSNARVVEVKGRDGRGRERRRRSNLRVVRLPSVDIRGGLQVQRVHKLEIPPGGGEGGRAKGNTGIRILSHEEIERAKTEEVLEEVRRENRWWREGRGGSPGNRVECSNCGKVMRVQETWVDPRRLDEILRRCRFNVFDPRIEEFVEKYAGGGDAWKGCEKGVSVGGAVGEVEARAESEERVEVQKAGERPKAARGVSLEDLSKRVSSKYKQEAEELEDHHQRMSSLLKSLLRKIDESREAFEECHLFRNEKGKYERVLTTTEPVVVSLVGNSVDSTRKHKLAKRDVKSRNKSRAERPESRSMEGSEGLKRKRNVAGKRWKENEEKLMTSWANNDRAGERSGARREAGEEKQKIESPVATYSERSWSSSEAEVGFPKEEGEEGSVTELRVARDGRRDWVDRWERREEGTGAGLRSTGSSGGSGSERQGFRAVLVDGYRSVEASFRRKETESDEGKALSEVSTERSGNNYESDFESLTNEPEEGGGECEEAEAEAVPCGKKLSTISEVDSELEGKLSDEQKTHEGSLNSDGLLDEPKSSDDVRAKKNISLTPEISHETSKAECIPSLKSTPTELVTSLNEILSALKDQFARTETLAEKLTENMKQDKSERAEVLSEDGMGSPWKMPGDRLVENLRSARKESTEGPKPGGSGRSGKCEDGMPEDSLSDEGGSSLGEVIVGGQRRCESSSGPENGFLKLESSRRSSWLSLIEKEATKMKPNVNSEEVSYSEGEIPSNMLLDSECCSSRSVGEVHH